MGAFSGFSLSLLLLSLLLLLLCHNVESRNSTIRIVGGSPTTISKNRYLVNLRINGRFSCGGALVSPLHVVTAAHCIFGVPSSSMTVVGGATRLTRRGVRRGVVKVIRPGGFNMRTLNKDIAVLKLSSPMRGRNIRPIALCRGSLKAGDIVKVSGWGLTNENNSGVPARVQSVRIPLISKKSCKRSYRGAARLTASMFCAGTAGRDACSGDSGGPLVCKGRLCGVVSWGIGCARRRYPGVYTSIRRMRGFIQRAMRS